MKSTGTSALRHGRTSLHGQIYHLVSCTHSHRRFFTHLGLARAFVNSIHAQDIYSATLCFVLMPDHFHWLVQFDDRDEALHRVVQRVKARTSTYARKQMNVDRLWQRGFYDRAIRREDDLKTVARYIVANPIRAGLVTSCRDYPHWDAIWLES